jgi:hypothetical protein
VKLAGNVRCILHCVPNTPELLAIAGFDGGHRCVKVKKKQEAELHGFACPERQSGLVPV